MFDFKDFVNTVLTKINQVLISSYIQHIGSVQLTHVVHLIWLQNNNELSRYGHVFSPSQSISALFVCAPTHTDSQTKMTGFVVFFIVQLEFTIIWLQLAYIGNLRRPYNGERDL